MEKRTRTSHLLDEWEVSSMEEDGCHCGCKGGAEAGFHLQASLAQLGRRGTTRRRVALLGAAGTLLLLLLLLLLLGVVAVLVTVGLGKPWHASLENRQPNHKTDILQSDVDGKQQVETPANKELKASKHPRALLTVSQNHNHSGKYLQWESKLGKAHCGGGFIYSDGDLVVPRTGYYRVYVQIAYESVAELCHHNVMLLTHSVLYYSDSYPENVVLLSSVDTVRCNETWKKSLYTSAVFHLEANGRLRVTSSQPNHIMKNEQDVFFGADLLPD
ncbi:lymphotoxin-alpha-like [Kryptolebias marmoratus]|uniref:lymphotoxin-alpha-like n=1 Tax=Kryptolebias marmoratus TaxID=37003 RepID=UPI0007F922BD|nr:lymphotoxin-alpha-like [Kryptolebias marmoratus]